MVSPDEADPLPPLVVTVRGAPPPPPTSSTLTNVTPAGTVHDEPDVKVILRGVRLALEGNVLIAIRKSHFQTQ